MHVILSWVAVGLLAIAIDLAYAKWNIEVSRGRTLRACFWSAICPVLGFASMWICLTEVSALIPSALGCAAGTWLAMRWK